MKKMLINAVDPEESRMAIVEEGLLADLIIETSLQELSREISIRGKSLTLNPAFMPLL